MVEEVCQGRTMLASNKYSQGIALVLLPDYGRFVPSRTCCLVL